MFGKADISATAHTASGSIQGWGATGRGFEAISCQTPGGKSLE